MDTTPNDGAIANVDEKPDTALDLLQTFILRNADQLHIDQNTDEPGEREQIYRATLKEMGALHRGLFQAFLKAVWEVIKGGLWAAPKHDNGQQKYESLHDWLTTEIEPFVDNNYLWDAVRVAERTITYVFQRENSPQPIVDTETGEIITADMLVDGEGVSRKLKETSSFFNNGLPPEQKDELVVAIVKEPYSKVKSITREIIYLPYYETAGDEPDTTTIVLPNLSWKQRQLLISLMGRSGQPIIMAGKGS